jgi:hypothetical protein
MRTGDRNYRISFDPDEMLHPADVFDHPSEVVNNPNLTLNEKRAVLALWACAVDAAPELRNGRNGAVHFNDIMDALKGLDGEAATLPRVHRLISRVLRWKQLTRKEREGRSSG